MSQIGCEICLKLQKIYSSSLREYAEAMQRQVNFISDGDFTQAKECHAAVDQIHESCAQHRRVLEHHEAAEHPRQRAYR